MIIQHLPSSTMHQQQPTDNSSSDGKTKALPQQATKPLSLFLSHLFHRWSYTDVRVLTSSLSLHHDPHTQTCARTSVSCFSLALLHIFSPRFVHGFGESTACFVFATGFFTRRHRALYTHTHSQTFHTNTQSRKQHTNQPVSRMESRESMTREERRSSESKKGKQA